MRASGRGGAALSRGTERLAAGYAGRGVARRHRPLGGSIGTVPPGSSERPLIGEGPLLGAVGQSSSWVPSGVLPLPAGDRPARVGPPGEGRGWG